MTDERLHRWLEAVDEPMTPAPAFATELWASLAEELGFRPSAGVPRRDRGSVPAWRATRPRRRYDVLLVAAILVAASVGAALLSGSWLQRNLHEVTPVSLLETIQARHAISIAVRPDSPQVTTGPGQTEGFDVDVARALADHVGLRGDVVAVDGTSIMDGSADSRWDVALPAIATWSIDPARFVASDPYYRWPHRLVVAAGSTAATADDLRGQPICAVTGDAGLQWLRGAYPATPGDALTQDVLERTSDTECFAALDAGAAVALVTAQLTDADLQVHAGIRVLGGPDPEPRPVIVRRQQGSEPDPGTLLRTIDDAIASMRADGTLTRLSQSRFGGADLTAP